MAKNYNLSDDLGRDWANKSPTVGEHGWENRLPVMQHEEIIIAGSKNQQPVHNSKINNKHGRASTLVNLVKHQNFSNKGLFYKIFKGTRKG
ncbi:MAG: hypothetical protein N0E48_19765 [Candidatus Thiodiazotropha endolucinida]|nr:hypothetical protein [Candidatus Thiodiazotropha taylori]MCW4345574.1 hypothetical protein [Candidatus Thiodiazotropha endolucinida]